MTPSLTSSKKIISISNARPVIKTKRQANFKDFKRFGAFKGLV
jgi:hypothetical protein